MARKACNTVGMGMDMDMGLPRQIYLPKCFKAAAELTETQGVAKTLLIT